MRQLQNGKWSLDHDELENLIMAGTMMMLAVNRVLDLHVEQDGFCTACSEALWHQDQLVGWYQAEWPCKTIQAIQGEDEDASV